MSNFDALVTKLREIFQIDRPELDFGVYRILNTRAGEIDIYLTTRLKQQVTDAFTSGAAANTDTLAKELTDKIAQYQPYKSYAMLWPPRLPARRNTKIRSFRTC
jgi:adenine-specific DNA-methyltransferase